MNPFFDKQVILDAHSNAKKVTIFACAPLLLAQGPHYDKFKSEAGTKIDGETIEIFNISPDAHLEVYADKLLLFGNMKLPGRNVTLVARFLDCLTNSTNDPKTRIGPPLIDVSGTDGPPPNFPDGVPRGQPRKNDPNNLDGKVVFGKEGARGEAHRIQPFPHWRDVDTPGQPGQGRRQNLAFDPAMDGEEGAPGAPGGHAGSITILASAITVDGARVLPPNAMSSACCLRLTANGGRGGNGDRGQAGGWGARGGFGAWYRPGLGALGAGWTVATDGGRGGDGGNGGKGGTGGRGGDSGTIVILGRPAAERMTVWCRAENKPGVPGNPGPGGYHGWKGTGGDGGKGCKPVEGLFNLSPDVPDGKKGSDGVDGQDGREGDPGTAGKQNATKLEFGAQEPNLSNALSQAIRVNLLDLMTQRARAAYLSIDKFDDDNDPAWKSLGENLKWIKQRIDAFPLMRAGESCQGEHTLAQRLSGVVNSMIINSGNRRDYFGKGKLFRPALTLEAYNNTLTKSLECLSQLEKKRESLIKELKDNEIAIAELQDIKHEADAVEAYLKSKLAGVKSDRNACRQKLVSSDQRLAEFKEPLQKELLNFEENGVLRGFGVDAGKLLNALTQIVFLGAPVERTPMGAYQLSPTHAGTSAAMTAIQIADLIDSGNKHILTDSGEPVDKRYVIKQLARTGKSLSTTLSEWTADGMVAANKDGISQLLFSRDELDNSLSEFTKIPGASVVRMRLDTYIDQVELHNKLISSYNETLLKEFSVIAEIQRAEEHRRQVDTSLLQTQKPGLSMIAYWASGVCEMIKANCLEQLYMAHRAEAFWAARRYSGVGALVPGSTIEVLDVSTLTAAQNQVSSNILQHLSEALATKSRFPVSQDVKETGVLVVLTKDTHPELFEYFAKCVVKKVGDTSDPSQIEFSFELPVVTKETKAPQAFHGMLDVRLTKVRPYLVGMETRSDHMVTIIHTGDELIQPTDDEAVRFDYDPRPISFVYSPGPIWSTKSETELALNWRETLASAHIRAGGELDFPKKSETQVLRKAAYAPIGPFTSWNIIIKYSDYVDLDITHLKAVVIDFHGFFRPAI